VTADLAPLEPNGSGWVPKETSKGSSMASVKDVRPRDRPTRHFSAHCSNAGTHRSDFVTEASSFEEAAMAFAERWAGPESECRVIVIDLESGERRGLRLHLGGAGV